MSRPELVEALTICTHRNRGQLAELTDSELARAANRASASLEELEAAAGDGDGGGAGFAVNGILADPPSESGAGQGEGLGFKTRGVLAGNRGEAAVDRAADEEEADAQNAGDGGEGDEFDFAKGGVLYN